MINFFYIFFFFDRGRCYKLKFNKICIIFLVFVFLVRFLFGIGVNFIFLVSRWGFVGVFFFDSRFLNFDNFVFNIF